MVIIYLIYKTTDNFVLIYKTTDNFVNHSLIYTIDKLTMLWMIYLIMLCLIGITRDNLMMMLLNKKFWPIKSLHVILIKSWWLEFDWIWVVKFSHIQLNLGHKYKNLAEKNNGSNLKLNSQMGQSPSLTVKWVQAHAHQTNGLKPTYNSWKFSINRDILIHFEDVRWKEELKLWRLKL